MLENIVANLTLIILWSGWTSLLGVLWVWTLSHPIYGLLFWTWAFFILFAAYSAFHAAQKSGGLIWFHWVMFAPALIFGYPLDVLWNTIFGTILFQEVPWAEDWRFWRWTFTGRCKRHVNDSGPRGRQARWWQSVLNPLDLSHV